jgi:hypothetical protein
MAKPNYSFEKRQREIAKKKKKEEKLREKADRKTVSPDGEVSDEAVSTPAAANEASAPAA